MNLAEKLTTIAENEQLVANANAELEEALYSKSEGGKDWYNTFWDEFQQNGTRYHYNTGFGGRGWTDELFKPKYNIIPKGTNNAAYIFQMTGIKDLKGCLEKQGVILDLTQSTGSAAGMFSNTLLEYMPEINISSYNTFANGFTYSSNLKRVEKIIVPASIQNYGNAFVSCYKLEHIIFEGEIASSIKFNDCSLLDKESIVSIVNCLSNTTTGYSLTLNKTAVEAVFTNEEWEEFLDKANKPNWTISLV